MASRNCASSSIFHTSVGNVRCLTPPVVLIAHVRLALQCPRTVVRSLRDASQSLTGVQEGRAGLSHGARAARAPRFASRKCLRTIPEHKGTERIQAKSQIKQLSDE